MARQPLVGQGPLIVNTSRSHSGTPDLVGLLQTSHQPVPKTYERITFKNISMPPLGFEPTISVGERSQTHTLDRAATYLTAFNVQSWFIRAQSVTCFFISKTEEHNRCFYVYTFLRRTVVYENKSFSYEPLEIFRTTTTCTRATEWKLLINHSHLLENVRQRTAYWCLFSLPSKNI